MSDLNIQLISNVQWKLFCLGVWALFSMGFIFILFGGNGHFAAIFINMGLDLSCHLQMACLYHHAGWSYGILISPEDIQCSG